MFWAAFVIIATLCLVGFNHSDNANYGPYDITWKTFETCKGPKQGECGKFEITNTHNMSDVIFLLDFPKDCPVTKARVTAGSLQKNNYTKKLWNYALDKPCQHFVLGPILLDAFKLNGACKIKKGQYTVHLNMMDTCLRFLGSSFFYGVYVFKIVGHNNANNFFCVNTKFEVRKL